MRKSDLGLGVVVASLLLATTGLVAASGPASGAATTLFVNRADPQCADSGSGTSSQPYCTISKAASVVAAGQTVLVSSGSYAGGVSVAQSGTSSAPIVIRSATGAAVTVTGGTNGFKVSSKSWITIKGFTVTKTSGVGIYLTGASHITLDGNSVSLAGHPVFGQTNAGIKLSSTTASVVVKNTTRNNTDHGISLTASSGNRITGNVSYGNARQIARAAAGIFLRNSVANTVDGNSTHGNEDSGIGLWSASNNAVVFNNLVYNNGDHGIDVLHSTGEIIVSNTVYRSADSGIEMQGDAGARLSNNISVDNGINSSRTAGNIRVVDVDSAAQTTLDYDQVSLSSDDDMIDYLGTAYSTLAAFRAAHGQEVHGRQGDPRFINPSFGDFHLGAGSPAIDSANSGAAGQPATDHDGITRRDDPSTPNTGAGPRPYDDRGAFEFVTSSK